MLCYVADDRIAERVFFSLLLMYDKCSLRGKRLLAFTERAREHAKGGGLLDPLVCARPRNFSLRPKRPFPSLCIKTMLSAQPLIRK